MLRKLTILLAAAAGFLVTMPAPAQDQPAEDEATSEAGVSQTGATLSEDDKAYVPPVQTEPPLPELPEAPVLDVASYPDCREDYQKITAPFDKAADTNRCTALIDQYYNDIMLPFRDSMIAYQNELSALYTNEVGGKMQYSAASQERFYKEMMARHAAADPDGDSLSDYRAIDTRYTDDRAYLQDRFCFNTGCGGYPVPTYVAKEDDDEKGEKASKKSGKKSAKKSKSADKCKKSRKRGGLLGGVLGGVVGDAAGLGTIGTLISSGVGAVLVSEIACQLTEEEQEVAAEATVEVTEKEEVGATSTWTSPTRSGVSGSSTVTALNTEPNGRRCLSITDVAIIDGVETRIAKQMCRGSGDEGYSIVA